MVGTSSCRLQLQDIDTRIHMWKRIAQLVRYRRLEAREKIAALQERRGQLETEYRRQKKSLAV